MKIYGCVVRHGFAGRNIMVVLSTSKEELVTKKDTAAIDLKGGVFGCYDSKDNCFMANASNLEVSYDYFEQELDIPIAKQGIMTLKDSEIEEILDNLA